MKKSILFVIGLLILFDIEVFGSFKETTQNAKPSNHLYISNGYSLHVVNTDIKHSDFRKSTYERSFYYYFQEDGRTQYEGKINVIRRYRYQPWKISDFVVHLNRKNNHNADIEIYYFFTHSLVTFNTDAEPNYTYRTIEYHPNMAHLSDLQNPAKSAQEISRTSFFNGLTAFFRIRNKNSGSNDHVHWIVKLKDFEYEVLDFKSSTNDYGYQYTYNQILCRSGSKVNLSDIISDSFNYNGIKSYISMSLPNSSAVKNEGGNYYFYPNLTTTYNNYIKIELFKQVYYLNIKVDEPNIELDFEYPKCYNQDVKVKMKNMTQIQKTFSYAYRTTAKYSDRSGPTQQVLYSDTLAPGILSATVDYSNFLLLDGIDINYIELSVENMDVEGCIITKELKDKYEFPVKPKVQYNKNNILETSYHLPNKSSTGSVNLHGVVTQGGVRLYHNNNDKTDKSYGNGVDLLGVKTGDIIYIKDGKDCVSDSLTISEMKVPEVDLTLTINEGDQKIPTCHSGQEGTNNNLSKDGVAVVKVSGGLGGYVVRIGNNFFTHDDSFGGFVLGGLSAGDYTVHVTDGHNERTGIVTIPVRTKLDITAGTPANYNETKYNTCKGKSFGKVTVSANYLFDSSYSNGYNITFNNTNATINHLSAGSHTVTLKNLNGCVDNVSFNITEPQNKLFASYTATPPKCNKNDEVSVNTLKYGSVNVSYSGGAKDNPSITLKASTGDNLYGQSLLSGIYHLTVSDGCTTPVSNQEIIIGPDLFKINNLSVNKKTDSKISDYDICKGDATTINVQLNETAGSFKYFIDGNNNEYDLINNKTQNLNGGNYSIKVKNSKGCITALKDITIREVNNELSYSTAVYSHPNCNVLNDATSKEGEVNLKINNETTNIYTVELIKPDNSSESLTSSDEIFNFTGLSSGKYKLKINDYCNSIVETDDINLGPTKLVVSQTLVEKLGCSESTSGKININATGGNGSYEFSFNGIDRQFANIGSTLEYAKLNNVLEVTDFKGCKDKLNFTMPVTPNPVTIIPTQTNTSCAMISDGEISVTASGGISYTDNKYDFVVDGTSVSNSGSHSKSGLKNGKYTIKSTDSHGCFDEREYELIVKPDSLKIESITATKTACAIAQNADISVNVSGGDLFPDGNFRYTVDGDSFSDDHIVTFNRYKKGNHIITVEDVNGCIKSGDIDIIPWADSIQLSPPTITRDFYCKAIDYGKFNISASKGVGPYEYSLNEDMSGSVNDGYFKEFRYNEKYTVYARDSEGCRTKYDNIVVPLQDSVSSLITTLDKLACASATNGTISVTASKGVPFSSGKYRFQIDQSLKDPVYVESDSYQFEELGNKTYTITTTDAIGCKTSIQKKLPELNNVEIENLTFDPLACKIAHDGVVKINAKNGLPYYDGSYNYILTSNNSKSDKNVSAEFTRQGYEEMVVRVVDSAGCDVGIIINSNVTGVFIPIIPDTIKLLSPSYDLLACDYAKNGAIEIGASGGVTYGGEYSFTVDGVDLQKAPLNDVVKFYNLNKDVHTVKVVDAEGCIATKDYTIPLLTTPIRIDNIIDVNLMACDIAHDGELKATAADGAAYKGGKYDYWIEDRALDTIKESISGSFDELLYKEYTVYARDSARCTTMQVHKVDLRPDPVRLMYPAFDSLACSYAENGAIDITAENGVSYSGDKYNFTLLGDNIKRDNVVSTKYFGLNNGVHTIQVHDEQGCSHQADITIPERVHQISFDEVTYPQHLACAVAADGIVASKAKYGAAYRGGKYDYWIDETNDSIYQSVSAAFDTLQHLDYKLFIRDSAGCINSTVIHVPLRADSVHLNFPAFDSLACSYASNAAVYITARGGAPYESDRYNFKIFGSPEYDTTRASQAYFPDLNIQPHTFEVTDEQGCKDDTTFIVPQIIKQIKFESVVHTKLGCWGASDGKIYVKAKDGAAIRGGNYTYVLDSDTVKSVPDFQYLRLNKDVHHLQAIDSAGCIFTSNEYIHPKADSIQIDSYLYDSLACDVANDGGIEILSSLGAGKHTFFVDGVEQLQNHFTRLNSNIHFVMIQDTALCKDSAYVDIPRTKLPIRIESIVYDSLYCKVAENGIITATAADGVGGYRYSVNDNVNFRENPFTDLKYNTDYAVGAIDKEGCTIFETVQVPVRTDTLITLIPIVKTYGDDGRNISCIGRTDGEIDITVINSVGSLFFDWTSNNGSVYDTEDIMAIDTGSYNVTVTDHLSNCKTSIFNIELHQPDSIDIIKDGQTVPTCFQTSDGKLMASATNIFSTTRFTLEETNQYFDEIDRNATFTDLPDGFYNIHVIDALGCEAQEILEVKNKEIVKPHFTVFSPDCPGSNGSIVLDYVEGHYSTKEEYSFEWKRGLKKFNTYDLRDVDPGTYTLTIVDNEDNCRHIYEKEYTIEHNKEVTNKIVVGDASCSDSRNGYIFIDEIRNPAQKNIQYTISNDDISRTANSNEYIMGLDVGDYTLKLEYIDDECDKSTVVSIGHTNLTIDNIYIKKATCSAVSDASATIEASGIKNADYVYSLDGTSFQNAPGFAQLTEGNYVVTVKDNNSGCTKKSDFTINSYPELFVEATLVDSASSGIPIGVVEAQYSGGTGRYNFNWEWIENSVATVDTSKLFAGTYKVTLSDKSNSGCLTESTIIVPSRTKINISEVKLNHQPLCDTYKGSAEIMDELGASPVKYYWIFGTDTISRSKVADNLVEGEYKVLVKDKYGVLDESDFQISKGELLAVSSTSTKSACTFPSAEVKLNVSGGVKPYKYIWDDGYTSGSDVRPNVGEGDYIVKVEDAVDCFVSSETINVETTPNPEFTVTLGEAYCGLPNATGEVVANGGVSTYKVEWINDDNQIVSDKFEFDSLQSGVKYSVLVTDSNGCFTTQNDFEVFDNKQLEYSVNVNLEDSSACDKGVGTLVAETSGGFPPFIYDWNIEGENSATLSNITPGEYLVEVVDNKGCKKTATGNMYNRALPLISSVVTSNSYCNKAIGKAVIAVIGRNPEYKLTLDDNTLERSNVEDVSSEIRNITVNNLSHGVHNVIAVDKFGCESEPYKFEISSDPAINMDINTVNNVSCNGVNDGKATFIINEGSLPLSYTLDGSDHNRDIAEDLAPGLHKFSVTDALGCSDSVSFTISEPEVLQISNIRSVDPLCYNSKDGAIAFDVSGGTTNYMYYWNSQAKSDVEDTLFHGNYHIVVEDFNGCKEELSVTLTNPELIPNTGIDDRVVICSGQEVDVKTDTIFIEGQWSSDFGLTSSVLNEKFSEPGKYYLVAKTAKGCEVKDTMKIELNESLFSVDFLMPTEAKVDDTVSMVEITWPLPDSSKWYFPNFTEEVQGQFGEKLLVFNYEGSYEIKLFSYLNECVDNVTKYIDVKDGNNQTDELVEAKGNEHFKIYKSYPNPNQGQFNINVELNNEASVDVEIYNVSSARYVLKRKLNSALKFDEFFDISNYKGINMAKITSNNIVKVLVFVVE